MEITGKVHCFFEQSGVFKNEFKKLGIPAEDYDIQNHFGETDHMDDLFEAIETAYRGGQAYLTALRKTTSSLLSFLAYFSAKQVKVHLHTLITIMLKWTYAKRLI